MSQENVLINLNKAVKGAFAFERFFNFENLGELSPYIADTPCQFQISGQFESHQGKPLLSAALHGTLVLICQRTLKTFEFPIDTTIKLGFVSDDRFFKGFPDDCEPFICQNDQIDLREIITQELLLNLPMIPKSPQNDCQVSENASYYSVSETGGTDSLGKDRPFSVLKTLKFDSKDND